MSVQRLKKFPEKALCLINFETNPNVLGQLLKDSSVLNLTNFIKYKYALFIRKSLRRKNIPKFNEVYTFFNENHVCNKRGSTNQMLVVSQFQTTHYIEHFLKLRSINAQNLFQRSLETDLIT